MHLVPVEEQRPFDSSKPAALIIYKALWDNHKLRICPPLGEALGVTARCGKTSGQGSVVTFVEVPQGKTE